MVDDDDFVTLDAGQRNLVAISHTFSPSAFDSTTTTTKLEVSRARECTHTLAANEIFVTNDDSRARMPLAFVALYARRS